MGDVETLTDNARQHIAECAGKTGELALRIIDAANARIAELEAEAKDHEADIDKWVAAESDVNARCAELQSRIAKAREILSEPSMWSDFAARAKVALSGE